MAPKGKRFSHPGGLRARGHHSCALSCYLTNLLHNHQGRLDGLHSQASGWTPITQGHRGSVTGLGFKASSQSEPGGLQCSREGGELWETGGAAVCGAPVVCGHCGQHFSCVVLAL